MSSDPIHKKITTLVDDFKTFEGLLAEHQAGLQKEQEKEMNPSMRKILIALLLVIIILCGLYLGQWFVTKLAAMGIIK